MKITLFAQIFQKIRKDSFNKLSDKFESNKHSKVNDAWSHFVTMVFCHFSKSNSLNEVCNGMRSATSDLNHLGVIKALKRSSLAYNNQHRNWELFQAMYFNLYDQFESTSKKSRKLLPNVKYIYWIQLQSISASMYLTGQSFANEEVQSSYI